MSENKRRFSQFTFLVIAGLLILTAWGNAVAMLTISAIALIGLAFITREATDKKWPAMLTGFLIAGAVVLVTKLIW